MQIVIDILIMLTSTGFLSFSLLASPEDKPKPKKITVRGYERISQ